MLNLEKTTELFDALQYCNKHIVGIEKDYVSHFYKIKHAILACIYKNPGIIEGYTLKIDGMETSNEGELLSITIKSELQCYKFHVPLHKKTRKQFGLTSCDINCIGPYWASEKIEGNLSKWMTYYILIKEIAYRWHVLNPYEDRMKLATKYPNQWKQNWSMFVSAFNKRFKNKYLLRGYTDDKRKCEIVRLRDNRVMYCLWCFKLMKDCSYINYMNRIDKKIKWHLYVDKFIEFNGGVFNTRHIIAMTKCKRDWGPQYGIALYITGDIERQWFDNEYERDTVFNQISRELLND